MWALQGFQHSDFMHKYIPRQGWGRGPEGKDVTFLRVNSARPSRIRWVNPKPASEETQEQAQAPPAPRNPCPPCGGGRQGRQGAPWAAGRIGPRPPLGFPGLPHPGAKRKTHRWERTCPPRRREVHREESPPPPVSGDRVAFEPPTHLQKKASRRLSAKRHLQGRDTPRTDSGAEWPHVYLPTSDEKPPPRGATDARPCRPRRSAPPPDRHQAPGLRQRLPPAAAGRGPSAACSPSGRTPAGPLGAHWPPTRSATRRGWRPRAVPPEGKQGWAPSGSPSPTHLRRRPQQRGDGGAGAASAGPP
ncbi:synapsin-1-like [Molossus molossus]|uniref:synapsin-1-like n=1 Tax=Molossus molossus TaxID=27622 RepID=UPI00174786A9|nr:synapsin-1-like [Molossus molossus]